MFSDFSFDVFFRAAKKIGFSFFFWESADDRSVLRMFSNGQNSVRITQGKEICTASQSNMVWCRIRLITFENTLERCLIRSQSERFEMLWSD